MTITAVAAALALALRQIALRTENRGLHVLPSAFAETELPIRAPPLIKTIASTARQNKMHVPVHTTFRLERQFYS